MEIHAHLQFADAGSGGGIPEPNEEVPRAGDDVPPDHIQLANGALVLAKASVFEPGRLPTSQFPHRQVSVLPDNDGIVEHLLDPPRI